MRIINVISRTNAYISIRDLNLKPRAAGTIDVDTLILSELKSLRNLYLANDIIISEIDFNYIVEKIASLSGGLGGGTASYPSFTGNAAKVLAVNATEDDVEWTTVSSGGGSGGGIKVIEYDPSLHEITADTVVDADFVPVNGTCTYNTTTKDIEIATPVMLNNVVRSDGGTYNAEYVGIKLNNEFNTGELTIDVTNCTSNFGMVLIPPTMTLEDFLTNYHGYTYTSDLSNPVNPSEIFGRVRDTWAYRSPIAPYQGADYRGYATIEDSTNLMSMTLLVGSYVAVYKQYGPTLTVEKIISLLQSPELDSLQSMFIDINTGTAAYNIKEYDVYFFMLAHGDSDTTATLAPTDKLKITHTLSEKVNTVPTTAVDGDFLHIGENMLANNLLGKTLVPSTFVQLYDNKTKMIVHSNLDNVDSGGGVALGETSSTAYRGDNGKIAYDHSQSQGNPHNTTTSEINEGTKLFFTEPRVRQTVLTGLDTSTASPALATDQLLAAIGKLQAQINNIAPPTWVSAASIGTTHSSFTNVQFAKINGLLWVRGYCNNLAFMGAGTTLFLLTNPSYHLDIPATGFLPIVLGEIKTFNLDGFTKLIQLKNVVNNANKFSLHNSTIFTSGEYNQIQPVALGRLLTP